MLTAHLLSDKLARHRAIASDLIQASRWEADQSLES